MKRLFQKFLSSVHKNKRGKGIVICGWVSSGSTFVYQIVRSLGFDPVSIHGTPDFYSPKAFFTFRDPRDIILSWAKRHFASTYENDPQKAIGLAIDFVIEEGYDQDYVKASNSPNIMFIRYEDYFGGREANLVKLIADQLSCPVSESEANKIHQDNSLDRNKERASKVRDFTIWDKDSLIHGGHVSNEGKVGGWRAVFSKNTAALFEKKLGHSLRMLKYEDNADWIDSQNLPSETSS